MKVFNVLPLGLGALVLFFTACSPAKAELPRQDIHLGTAVFHCELALTPQDRATGLMNREKMAPEDGMLFVFPDEVPRTFWMKNTSIPLTIAYINKQGVVKSLLDMTPFSLDSVPSTYSVTYALEVNQGVLAKKGIKVGDQIAPADLGKIPSVNQ